MNEEENLLDVMRTVLRTLDTRQSFSPGMFEPLQPLFRRMGYETIAIYIADDYPDRMQMISGYGGEDRYPPVVDKFECASLLDGLRNELRGMPGLMTERLFSHGRELGAVAATTTQDSPEARSAFQVLAQSLSVMAYVERIRTNDRRERQEREIFFAQSLTNRLLIRETPKVKGLRLGFEFIRSLEAGGDFFDFIPTRDGGLGGFIGCCNGKGLRTVLEVATIMRAVHRAYRSSSCLSDILLHVNDLLIREKRRAHQASLCLFEIDCVSRTLRLAKAGRLGLLHCGPGGSMRNISAPGGLFLGMVPNPKLKDEVYEFLPGQSLFCVTEGFYSSRNCMNVQPQLHWFLRAVETTLEAKRKTPLANAIFDGLDSAADYATRPSESMLALSVEFTGK